MRTLPKGNRKPQGREAASSGADLPVRDFDQMSEQQEELVEHQSIPGFIRRIPHQWHIDEINRFGKKMGDTADSLQLAYVTRVDRSLGLIRVFPVPLLVRVYTIMAPQFGWPAVEEIPRIVDAGQSNRSEAKKQERFLRGLETLTETVDDVEVLESLKRVRDFIRADVEKRRATIDLEPAAQTAS